MRIFLTGGSGFVGREALLHLQRHGHSVVALARTNDSANKLETLGTSTVLGSLQDISAWKGSLKGCDAVVHCAAPVEFWGDRAKFEFEIATASRDLLMAANDSGIKKFVYISSESVLQDKDSLLDVDETSAYPALANSYYGQAKMLAEKWLLQSTVDVNVVILRPAFVWGEHCPALNDIGQRISAGTFIWANQGQIAFEAIHVRNLAESIRLAVTYEGQGKSVYFVTDDHPGSFRDFFAEYAKAMNLSGPTKNLPAVVVKWAAVLCERIWRLLGIRTKPPITRFEWAFVAMSRRYNITKIKKDLKYKPIVSRSQGFENIRGIHYFASAAAPNKDFKS